MFSFGGLNRWNQAFPRVMDCLCLCFVCPVPGRHWTLPAWQKVLLFLAFDIATPQCDLAKWLEMLEKLQAKTSFVSARWWFKSLIIELAQIKNVKHTTNYRHKDCCCIFYSTDSSTILAKVFYSYKNLRIQLCIDVFCLYNSSFLRGNLP